MRSEVAVRGRGVWIHFANCPQLRPLGPPKVIVEANSEPPPWLKPGGSENLFQCSLRLSLALQHPQPSHWIIFFLNGRSALRDIALGGCRSIPTLADSLSFQHRPSFESGSALGASFPTRMLGVHLLCKELKPKQPKTETPGLKVRACALSVTSSQNAFHKKFPHAAHLISELICASWQLPTILVTLSQRGYMFI